LQSADPTKIVATKSALQALAASGELPDALLRRHWAGDSDDLAAVEELLDGRAAHADGRLVSVFLLADRKAIWVVTTADRATTRILSASEC
jgi:hypothetical protein